jgi:cobalt-zinc-cadmium efflux system outer membrane protein
LEDFMELSLSRAWRVGVAICLVSAATGVSAADRDEPRGALTLAQAIDAALQRNPALQASRYDLTAAQARVLQAGMRLNPEVGLELENFAGSGAARGTEALEATLSLGQVVELGGKRGLRRSVAEADSDLVAIELRAQQLDVLADVTRRYIDVVAAQERERFASENTGLAQQTLDAITARVKAARSPVAESSRARIAATRASIEKRQAELGLHTARSALASSWGSSDAQFSTANADLFAFNAIQPFEALSEQLERNPDLARFATDARLRDAELRLAQAQTRPNIALSLGVRRFQESGDSALVAGFSMPLALYDRNQGAIREARVRRAQSEAELQAARSRARSTLFAIYQEMLGARERAQALRNDAVPQAQDALQQTQSGYDRGRFSFLELLTSQQDLLALREAAIDAAADYHRLLAELERITSEPLTTQNLEASLP